MYKIPCVLPPPQSTTSAYLIGLVINLVAASVELTIERCSLRNKVNILPSPFRDTLPASFALFSEMQEEDSEWAPPSEAELKVINARRERSDKISKLMSEYLLKGYKMLATTCHKCMSIELKTREGEIYCVACSEVDCEETSKDNPLLNRQAAESQLRENALAATPKSPTRHGRRVLLLCIGFGARAMI